jgi:DNA polymerase III delta prime subunit
MAVTQKLFTELFRPKALDGLILPSRVRAELSKGLTQNLMLYSSNPGTGKSSIARILTQGYDTLKLNGSSENGIDTIRNQVVQFASTISLEDGAEKIKVIYIDEADGLTEAAWDALRETIERYADSVRYICTCNKIDKIPGPIKSRFNCVPLYPINKSEETLIFSQYCEYVGKILTALKINFEQDVLVEFVKNSFPDMRSILNTLQTLYNQGAKELDRESLIKTFDCSDLFELIITGNDPVENYKFIMTNYSSSPDEAMLAISQSFIEFVRTSYPQYNNKIPYLIITIAEYMAQLNTSPDRVIVLLACCFKLQTILKS